MTVTLHRAAWTRKGPAGLLALAWVLLLYVTCCPGQGQQNSAGWPAYGGDPGGQRYSAATQVTPSNVANLQPAWSYHTHALDKLRKGRGTASFEATPVLSGDSLFLSTPFDEVIALEAATGRQLWRFDPALSPDLQATIFTSRGVAVWDASQESHQAVNSGLSARCVRRVFLGTLDARLIALDATDGKPCDDFGAHGSVDLKQGITTHAKPPYNDYGVTSPPAVAADTVVVGSVVGDNEAAAMESGTVRGFDARTGRLRWSWDPLAGLRGSRVLTGAGNTWSAIAVDQEHGIVYLPTSSPSPDFYGGKRLGDDRDADSLVALDAVTGRKLWAFQTVHHNLWDYDIAAEPLLFTLHGSVPAVAITTKTGMIYVLNRLSGALLSAMHEQTVAQSDVAGERSSRTQPVSDLPSLAPLTFQPRPAGLGSPEGDRECAAMLHGARYQGIFTPPSIGGTLVYPGSLGGVNWGSAALDPETGVLYANTNRLAFRVELIPRWRALTETISHEPPLYYGVGSALLLLGAILWRMRSLRSAWPGLLTGLLVIGAGIYLESHPLLASERRVHFGSELSEQRGTPFWVYRRPLVDAQGLPCIAPPWGALTGVDLEHGRKVFETPLGTLLAGRHTGTVGLGGPVVTKGGLIFTATSREPLLRAFDKRTGTEVWQGKLPVPAQATPMVYSLHGREYVVICAGGHGAFGTKTGDTVLAFALPAK